MIGKGTWDDFLVTMEKSLGKDCPITLDHAMTHLNSAIESNDHGEDQGQVAHDAHVAGRILMILAARIEKTAG